MQYIKEYIADAGKGSLAMLLFIGGDLIAVISGVSGKVILIPWWAWLIIGIIALVCGQFMAYRNVKKELDKFRNPVRSAISELKREVIKLGGKDIDMASMLWKVQDSFLGEGMRPNSIPGAIYEVVEGVEKEECNEGWRNMIKRLELLELIYDKEYPHPHRSTGYIRIKLTSLGASVLNELGKSWRSS